MLLIKAWCLPQMTPEEMETLERNLVKELVNVAELNMLPVDIACFFPSEIRKVYPGRQILIEVCGNFRRHTRIQMVRPHLETALNSGVHSCFPHARIILQIYPFSQQQLSWSS